MDKYLPFKFRIRYYGTKIVSGWITRKINFNLSIMKQISGSVFKWLAILYSYVVQVVVN